MYDIHCRKIVLTLVAAIAILVECKAQFVAKDNLNYLDFQDKSYYFGFAFGSSFSRFRINQSNFLLTNAEDINVVESKPSGGFNIHMIANLKMGEFFDFRFNPGFAFTYRNLLFNNLTEKKIESVFFETPFGIRFKSMPYKDKRAFFSAGLKYGYDVASNANSRKGENIIKISPHEFQWEAGIGVQLYYPYFIFSPEIKMSRGLNNSLIYNRSLSESKVLDNIVSQLFTITFNFEG
jgi:hypothetical protein